MNPARQGDLDGLCGLYAIINALDVVGVGGPRRALHRNLFHRLAQGLGPERLAHGLRYGLTAEDLRRAAKVGFRWLAREHGYELKLTQPLAKTQFLSLPEFIGAMQLKLGQGAAATIVHVQIHGTAHWSAVKSVRGDLMVLRDSYGRESLDLDQFALCRGARFFRPTETLVIQRFDTAWATTRTS